MPLISQIPELRVFTPGNDGNTLSFNPLQPEDGILIENHVAAVVRALTAATGGEHPIPEACDGLLKQTYQQFGWEYGMMAYTDEHRSFPTFKNVLDNVDSYIAAHARYGPEVRQNLTAALTLRTETMHSGAMGNLFSNAKGLQAAEILAAPCVIELADFSPQSASFIMNILLYKFHSYLSRQPESSQLNRVIVVEEAHNVFKRTLSEENGRALSNEYFDKMLAEIRSSGTGLLLSDQRASLLSEAVMANTSVKILHALDYILKPINYFSFKLKIQKALETVRRVQGTLLTIASDHGQQLVRDSEILYIEVQGHNLIYHTLHGDLTATGTLKQIEAQLKPSGFYRCNYCYLVNLRHVGFLDGSEVTVGQYKLQISRNRRKEFLQQLTQFYGRGGR